MPDKKIPAPERKTIETWAQMKGTPDWLFAGAKAFKRWGIGQEVFETDYETAILETGSVKIGYGS